MSRKHAVESRAGLISIFGGKLTDCLNVGEEVVAAVARSGIPIPHPGRRWYGEPPDETRDEFFHQARLMNLDAMTAADSSEPLSTRLWRRYGAQALGLLEQIREDPADAELLIEHAEYLRCEIEQAARREMITKLEDFLRRRSKIALVVSRDELRTARGVREACAILFGDEADAKYDEYFASHPDSSRGSGHSEDGPEKRGREDGNHVHGHIEVGAVPGEETAQGHEHARDQDELAR
jgi:glycerol-3-phosphate dehydrogenase